MKIFVIDDQAANIEAAKAAIEAAGHEYATPFRAEQALAAVKLANAPDGGDDAGWAAESLFRMIRLTVKLAKETGGGVLTDLMFRNTTRKQGLPPAGLLVVVEAIAAGVPVVVCTNAKEVGGHHSEAISWIFDGYVGPHRMGTENTCPFGWVEDKNWSEAIKVLVERRAKLGAG